MRAINSQSRREASHFTTETSATPHTDSLLCAANSSEQGRARSKPFSSGLMPSDTAHHSHASGDVPTPQPGYEPPAVKGDVESSSVNTNTVVTFPKRPSSKKTRKPRSVDRNKQRAEAQRPRQQRETGMDRKAMQNVRIDILQKELAGGRWSYKSLSGAHGCSESSIKMVIEWMASKGEMHQPNGKGSKWRITDERVQQLKEKGVA